MASTLQPGQTQSFSATVANDPQSKGVAWTLGQCAPGACGQLSATTSLSGAPIVYTAPSQMPASPTIILIATSITNPAKSASATITMTAPAAPISVSVSPQTQALSVGQAQNFTATVQNDAQNKGVSWNIVGANCGANVCGTLSGTSSLSGVSISYTAPAQTPNPATVTLVATSIADSTATASATITIGNGPPQITVDVAPASQTVTVGQKQTFTATVQNDAQNKGVNWTLSGAGCSGAACGKLSSSTSASGTAVTYTAPGTAPNPAAVTLTATSVADSKASASATISINTPPPPPVGVAITPNGQTVQVNQSQDFTATVKNDPKKQGVTWTLTGTGCTGAACGSLSSTSSASGAAITYTAPATVPKPAVVTLTATSVGKPNASASVSITISTPPIAVTVAPGNETVMAKQSAGFAATVKNDAQNKGVTWTLTGSGCSGAACGTLSKTSSASGASILYTAPATVPNPAGVTLTATSVSDATASGRASITIGAAVPVAAVVTQHYDIGRTGANTSETILTPANVNSQSFGKLFSYEVDGYVYAQPLYMSGLTMGAGTPQAGTTHNVVFVATENDSVYAFDADSNSTAANAVPLWQASLLDAAHGAAAGARAMLSTDIRTTDLVPKIGITGTPVIDPGTGTLYVVSKTKESNTYVLRLHALSILDGTEKFGGPVKLTGSVPGNGSGSVSGTLHFDPFYQLQRSGLLLLNGIVYMAFGSHQDIGPWHGWVLAYNAATLQQTGIWCSTPNSLRGGIWGAGSGIPADVPDPVGHPFGRMFVTTGNGTFDAVAPNYTNAMDYGDSVIRLDLSNGVPSTVANGKSVGDSFTPFNQAALDTSDLDQGSGAALMLPDAAGGGQHLLVQGGKTGKTYVLNRDNLGGYHPSNTSDPQQKTSTRPIFGMPAYWNGNLYFWGSKDHLGAFSFASGVISSTPKTSSVEFSGFPGSTPVVSANGNSNGIVWNIISDQAKTQGNASLQAHDASNVGTLLYSSDQDLARDNPGAAVKFAVPTVINGKVYVGTETQISVFGLLNGQTQVSAPSISPASESFGSSVRVTITDSTSGATIYFTTDGSTPTAASPTYSGPFTVSSSETINAIALASGHLASNVSTATYTHVTQAAMPTFSPAPGTYTGAQLITISSSTAGATIYYTTDGSTPTTASTQYTGPVTLSKTATLQAIAAASGLTNSAVASGVYTIQ